MCVNILLIYYINNQKMNFCFVFSLFRLFPISYKKTLILKPQNLIKYIMFELSIIINIL